MSLVERIEKILAEGCEKNLFSSDDYVLEKECSLAKLTSFRTGGNAVVLFPKIRSVLCWVFPALIQAEIECFVLGMGSNVIALDEGYPGLVLSLTQMKKVEVGENEIEAEAGASVTGLSSTAQKNSLSGMEFFYGIPGSVGGAVFMNAGAYGGECKDILKSVTYLTGRGEVVTSPVSQLKMGYRTSVFEENGAVILSAVFSLNRGSRDQIRATMEDLMGRRVEKQPLEYPSAGSTFKRYEGRFTAKMIEEAGLKGYRVGGAQVSEKHAGFVINYDNATSRDILDVISHVQERILEKEGIRILREVRIMEAKEKE